MRLVFWIVCLQLVTNAGWLRAESTLKEQAIEEFKRANYSAAIELLERALTEVTNDAEIYYYLGYFTHYLCYDSVPLSGYSEEQSDLVLSYLSKAIEIDPDYGDAYYFLGAEYGARATRHLKNGDAEGARAELALARERGGLPDWLLEYGRNSLRTCEPDAILIAGGDADTNPILYLQLVEGYRRDATLIPFALLQRPWFVALLKHGIDGVITPAPISWSAEQIVEMHPYKWKTNRIVVPVPPAISSQLDLQTDFEWELEPDLGPGLLSATYAVLADIIRTNEWRRPVYFSASIPPASYHGLDAFFQSCGTTYKLMPLRTGDTQWIIDAAVIEDIFMNPESYRSLPTVVDHDMPRVSAMLGNYRSALLRLSYDYYQGKDKERAKEVFGLMEEMIREEYVPLGNAEAAVTSYRKLFEE